MKSIEATIQKTADVEKLQKLQKKLEENENKIKNLMENNSKGRYHGSTERRMVEEVIEKALKERDNN